MYDIYTAFVIKSHRKIELFLFSGSKIVGRCTMFLTVTILYTVLKPFLFGSDLSYFLTLFTAYIQACKNTAHNVMVQDIYN